MSTVKITKRRVKIKHVGSVAHGVQRLKEYQSDNPGCTFELEKTPGGYLRLVQTKVVEVPIFDEAKLDRRVPKPERSVGYWDRRNWPNDPLVKHWVDYERQEQANRDLIREFEAEHVLPLLKGFK